MTNLTGSAPKPSLIPNNAMTSIVGSIALAVAGMAVGWLSSHNIISEADVAPATATIAAIIVGVVGAGIVWFKATMATKNAQITAVNSTDNGVKVVAATANVPTVHVPLK